MEGEGDLIRDRFMSSGHVTRAGPRDDRATGVGDDTLTQCQPRRSLRVPGESELGEPGRGRGTRSGLDLGCGQQVGERVEVVADADAALRAGLERGGAAPREGIEHDVAGPRVASDERVGEGRREAGKV
jgi:hypothetical protein